MADLGVLEPYGSKWDWQWLNEMEIGDYFYVAHEDKAPGKVRNYVAVSGNRLGRSFSVSQAPAEMPGFTKVTRVDPNGPDLTEPMVTYEVIDARIKDAYGVSIEVFGIPWPNFKVGDWFEGPRRRIKTPRREDYVVWKVELDDEALGQPITEQDLRDLPEVSKSFHVQLLPDRIRVTRLANETTIHDLMQQRREIDELMS